MSKLISTGHGPAMRSHTLRRLNEQQARHLSSQIRESYKKKQPSTISDGGSGEDRQPSVTVEIDGKEVVLVSINQ